MLEIRINLPIKMTHHPPEDVRRPLVVVLLGVSRPPLHDESVEVAELEQVEYDEDDCAHRHEDGQEPDEVASCECGEVKASCAP